MSLAFLLRKALQLRTPHPASSSLIVPAIERLRITTCTAFPRLVNFSTEAAPAVEPSAEGEGKTGEVVDSSKINGRTVEIIPVETSIRYLQSRAYSITYGSNPVWKSYRRNFKGGVPPKKTRKRCIRAGKISTGNPCPICRDDYLVLAPENIGLLKQFISPHTGQTLSYKVTGICQRRHKELLSAIDVARDRGAIPFDVPFRPYNYSEYKQ